jgi:hypothetical protein
LEQIPEDWREWRVSAKGASGLSATLHQFWDHALLFRKLAILVTEGPAIGTLNELRWTSPKSNFPAICEVLKAPDLVKRASKIQETI